MINLYSGVKVIFDSGGSNVVGVEVLVKEDNSNNVYVVEKFDKEYNNWADDSEYEINFVNDKIKRVLPENQLYRLYDNVPRFAGCLEVINNRLVFGNYTENYDLVDLNGEDVNVDFSTERVSTYLSGNSAIESLKSTRTYEFALGYLDKYGRLTTPLTCLGNTLYIENKYATFKNQAKLYINNKAPEFAVGYRIFIRQPEGDYDTIVPTLFYQDGLYVWIKLDGDDIHKIKEGDYIYVKADTQNLLDKVVETKILEIKQQDRNFLEDDTVTTLEQVSGTYFKIKPNNFRINTGDYTNYEFKCYDSSSNDYNNPIRNEVNVIEPASYYGLNGVNDLTSSGTYTGTEDIRYIIRIDAEGTPDTFEWSDDGGMTFTTGVAITGAAQTLSNGVQITFTSTTGHTLNDRWVVSAKYYRDDNFGLNEGSKAYAIFKSLDSDTIEGGASISITYDEYNEFTQFVEYSFISSKRYNNLEEWFHEENIIDKISDDISESRIWFRRGVVGIVNSGNYFSQDANGNMCMIIKSLGTQNNDTDGIVKVKSTLSIFQPNNAGQSIIFETKPVKDNSDIFYEIGKTYSVDTTTGYHLGDVDQTASTPCEITLGVFNCFTWGNGFESYKIKDAFNSKGLSIKTRPLTPIDNYRKNIRGSSLTYSNVFEQSTNYNGLNEFNLSTANYKDLDDEYGTVQRLLSENTDLLVFQEDKTHKVLVNKSILYNADGSGNVRQIDDVLGQEVPFAGNYGICKDPRSLAVDGYRKYHSDDRRNAFMRLSADGYTKISDYGMRSYIRDYFSDNNGGLRIGEYDSYHDQYVTYLGDGVPDADISVSCNQSIAKNLLSGETLDYNFILNDKSGDVTINIVTQDNTYQNITATATFNGNVYNAVDGGGTNKIISFTRDTLTENEVQVNISTTSDTNFVIYNNCPVGAVSSMRVIILKDLADAGTSMGARMKVNNGSWTNFYVPQNEGLRFTYYEGIEGEGMHPEDGDTITVDVVKNSYTNGIFDTIKGNKIGYRFSAIDWDSSDLTPSNLTQFSYPTVSEVVVGDDTYYRITGVISRPITNVYGYILFDFRDTIIDAVDDSINVLKGGETIIDILDNDIPSGLYEVTIITPPVNGTATVNSNNQIVYVHDDSATTTDSIVYELSNQHTSDQATISISVVEMSVGATQDFLMSENGSSSTSTACAFTASYTRYHDGANLLPVVGDIVYTDLGGTTVFDGGGLYYKIGTSIFVIDNNGEVVLSSSCEETPPTDPEYGEEVILSATGETTSESACTLGGTNIKYFDGSFLPSLGDTIYNEVELTTTFNGGNLWWNLPLEGMTIKVSTVGLVTNIALCKNQS